MRQPIPPYAMRFGKPAAIFLAAAVALPWLPSPVSAGQLLYAPVNPSFGGNPLNGPTLLQNAQAQKRYPYPMDDLGLDNIGQILQTDNGFLIQKGDKLYWIDLNGNSHPIELGSASTDAPIP
ncbi:MAG: curli assembly protein CsgF [Castellaniella sp.]|uniref:curli assembly protein CsgF n=1 Tax=Castellaniella sp. TaxID=1955812 RepID=UPI002A37221B|nr:curli assembly protein CsgF [Castellaniella sp.]MDY0308461.1 curli assembly protein CsgF [Castellaniella sp.]